MGNLEKLVVLTVLFLSAVVLAATLSGEGEDPDAGGPLAGLAAAGEPAAIDPRAPVLSAEVERKAPARETSPPGAKAAGDLPDPTIPRTSVDGRPRILWSREGLQPSPMDDFMLYVCAEGDSWAGLARRFYRDERHVPLLRSANEGMEAPVAGVRVLVPVFDFRAAPERQPVQPAPRRTDAPVLAAASTRGAEGAAKAPTATPKEYVVQSGDSLSLVSKKVYGTATRWAEIFQANRDVLTSPDRLDVGTKLRIP